MVSSLSLGSTTFLRKVGLVTGWALIFLITIRTQAPPRLCIHQAKGTLCTRQLDKMTEVSGLEVTLATFVSAEVRPGSSLDPLLSYIHSLSDSQAFDQHIQNKLLKNRLSFPLPDKATRIVPIREGFLISLESGKLFRIQPPACEILEIEAGPITGLTEISARFYLVSTEREIVVWSILQRKVTKKVDCNTAISALMANSKKDIVAVGCENGSVQLYHIEDYDQFTLNLTCTLEHLTTLEAKKVLSMRTHNSTTWLACLYACKSVAIWDHETCALLYDFCFTGTNVLPAALPQGQAVVIPACLWSAKKWEVHTNKILLSSGTVIRINGSTVNGLYGLSRNYAPDDKKWAVFTSCRKKGCFTLDFNDTLLTFLQPNTVKTPHGSKKWPQIEIDLNIAYSDFCVSELGTYLGLVTESSVEVVGLTGVESHFLHSLQGTFRYRNSAGCVHWRFRKLFSSDGKRVLATHGKAKEKPHVNKDGSYVVVDYTNNKNKRISVIRTSDQQEQAIAVETQYLGHCFSKDNAVFALLESLALSLWDLSHFSKVLAVSGKFDASTKLLYTESRTLFVFNGLQLIVISDYGETQYRPWNNEKVVRLPGALEAFLAYSRVKIAHFVWTNQEMTSSSEANIGFNSLKVFNCGAMCAGTNATGTVVLNVPGFQQLLQFPASVQLLIHRDSAFFATFDCNSESVRIWDLVYGIPLWKIDVGLQEYMKNPSKTAKSAAFEPWLKQKITYHRPDYVRLYRNWGFDLSCFSAEGCKGVPEAANMSIFEEKLGNHIVLLKSLCDLVSLGKYDSALAGKVVIPFNINVLHIAVYRNQPLVLVQALNDGASVVKSVFGTSIALCMEQNTKKCLDILLNSLIEQSHRPNDLLAALYHMKDDISGLIRFGSSQLPGFLHILMRPKPEEMVINSSMTRIPCSLAAPSLWTAQFSEPSSVLSTSKQEAVTYLVCPVTIHAELGTRASLHFLHLLVSSGSTLDVLNNHFVRSVVDMKWNKLWFVVLFFTLCYWAFLLLMLLKLFHYGNTGRVDSALVALNSFFLAFELYEWKAAPCQYLREKWNYADLLRCGFVYAWVFADPAIWLAFLTVLLCLLRGLTTFQTFDRTRFFVRMIYVVCLKTVNFIFIFIYSTFAFGLLFAAADPASISTFPKSWSVSSQLDMGAFDLTDAGGLVWAVFLAACLVNVVWLLNLLVSILGQAYEEFRPESEGADVLAKAELVYQYETMMVWRRNAVVPEQCLQTWMRESTSEVAIPIEVKLAQMSTQIAALEGKLINLQEFRLFQETIESRFLEQRATLKQIQALCSSSKPYQVPNPHGEALDE